MKYFIPSIIIGRGIGIATIVFGFSIIPFESFNTLYDWLVFITVCGIWIYIIFKMAHKLNEKIEKNQNEIANNEQN
jgi:ATP/ADP translocase